MKKQLLGHSVLHREIYVYVPQNPRGKVIVITGGIHGREYITSALVMKLISYYKTLSRKNDIIFIPCINPDGAMLSSVGLDSVARSEKRKFLLSINKSTNFSLWKANANAVDLNVNFDADWGGGRQNVFSPASQNYVGSSPESEPETKCVADFLREIKPEIVISFHSKGEVIYYGFNKNTKEKIKLEKAFANKLSKINGYQIIQSKNSSGGLGDYCSFGLGAISATIEVGKNYWKHPIKTEKLNQIFEKNKKIIDFLINY